MSKINNYHYVPACPEQASSSSLYSLLNRQEPIHARISTNNERDRRPIDPPPIIQIKLNNATQQQIDVFHQNSYFYMCANLAHPTDDNEIYTPTHNALSGQTVSSMYKLKDINNHDGAFFIFGDLSVKVEGCFRLKLSLFEITSTGSVCLQSIFTGPFTVYPTKKFPGMLDSTFLSRSFSDQGARIRIRKENRSAQSTNNNAITQRKRKLEQEVPLPVPSLVSQRRSSITSSTDSCNSSESGHSPVTPHFNSPRVSLSPFSPPPQNYDKFFMNTTPITTDFELPFTYQSSFLASPTQKQKEVDFTIKLPPIRETKRAKTSSIEQDAVFAMIQLSHPPAHSPYRKNLFI